MKRKRRANEKQTSSLEVSFLIREEKV